MLATEHTGSHTLLFFKAHEYSGGAHADAKPTITVFHQVDQLMAAILALRSAFISMSPSANTTMQRYRECCLVIEVMAVGYK